MKAVFTTTGGQEAIDRAYDPQTRGMLEGRVSLLPGVRDRAGLMREDCRGVELIFSTWGMPALTEEEIAAHLPRLKAVFYAAGSVQGFARPFLARGVRVFSAWQANAVPVAEYTLAQILLANKGFFQAGPTYRRLPFHEARGLSEARPGNWGAIVGIIGAGVIGRMVMDRLAAYEVEVWVCDPFLSEGEAVALGAKKRSLPEIFSGCHTISNHMADNAQTRGMIGYDLLSSMMEHAVLINTGRGAQFVAQDMIKVFRERPDLTAVLDVTDPQEPLPREHPLWQLDNVLITPHIAGSISGEIQRMGQYMLQALLRMDRGDKEPYEVTEEMLATMA